MAREISRWLARQAAIWLTRLALLMSLCVAFVSAHADVRYVYDEAGRLIAVIAPNGESAQYHYDALGNITAITRVAAASVSIFEFSPNAGPSGTTVTIWGSGFSTTPSQNTVTFNGAAASVVSAEVNKLVVAVPNNATTGAIAVSTPSGTATSLNSFTVVQGGSAVALTGFTPSIGPAGTAVTINGSGFQTNRIDNKVTFTNQVAAYVSTASSTAISSSVPAAAVSGRLRVQTPYSTAVSAADFFVPPAPYTAADVLATGRFVLGGSPVSLEIATADKIGLLVFDAVAGQGVTLTVANSTIPNATITVFDTKGTVVASIADPDTRTGAKIEIQSLPKTGTYQVLVRAVGSTGVMALSGSAGLTNSISVDGGTLTSVVTTAAQTPTITFSGTAGQQLGLGVTNSTITRLVLKVLKPDGTELLTPQQLGGGGFPYTPMPIGFDLTLPAAGTYTIVVDPEHTYTGNVTLTLSSDLPGTLTVNGAGTPLNIPRAGQNARLTFSGTAGDTLALHASAWSGFGSGVSGMVYDPSGAAFYGCSMTSNSPSCALAALSVSGTYSVFLSPDAAATGSMTLALNRPAEVTGTLAVDGDALVVSIPQVAQVAKISFAGTAGQQLGLGVTNSTITRLGLRVLKPDGTQLLAPQQLGDGGYPYTPMPIGFDLALPVAGTYTIVVDPEHTYTGHVTLTLSSDANGGTLTVGGSTLPLSVPRPGQSIRISFSALAGDHLTLNTSAYGGGLSAMGVRAYNTAGSEVGAGNVSSSSPNMTLPMLAAAANYTMRLSPSNAATGAVTIALSRPPDVTGTLTADGASLSLSIAQAGQVAKVGFNGSAGQTLGLGLTGNTIAQSQLSVLKPDGSPLVAPHAVLQGEAREYDLSLPVTGNYELVLNPEGANTGNATFTLSSDLASGVLTTGGAGTPVTITRAGQNARLTFSAAAGENLALSTNAYTGAITTVTVRAYNPGGTEIAAGTLNSSNAVLALPTISTAGTYSVLLSPAAAATGGITLAVSTPPDVTGTLIVDGAALQVAVVQPAQVARISFSGTAGQTLGLGLTGNTIAQAQLSVLKPDGTALVAPHAVVQAEAREYDLTLPVTGTYQIVLDPDGANIGNATLTLSSDVGGTLAVGAGGDPQFDNVVALLHLNGTDGSQVFTDQKGHTFEVAGGGGAPEIDTAQSKFGSASALFPDAGGQTGSIRSNHADFALGSGDFTVEGFLRKSGAGRWSLLSIGTVNQAGSLWVGGEGFSDSFYVRIGGVTDVVSGTLSISTGEFHHFALTRQGTAVRFFVDGVQQGATGTSGASVTGTELQWGNTNGADSYAMNYGSAGHADELRLTKGIARYTANFTPPSAPFPDSADGPTVSIGRAGQNAKLTFNGSAGENLILSAGNFNGFSTGTTVRVFAPSGAELVSCSITSSNLLCHVPTLPSTGTYTVRISPNAASTGSFALALAAQEVTGTLAVDGAALPINIALPQQLAKISFSGTAGQTLGLGLTGNTITQAQLSVLKPDGTALVASHAVAQAEAREYDLTLPVTGTYQIVLDPDGANIGNATLTLSSDVGGTLAVGAGGDPQFDNVVALLHLNGADGSQVFTDQKGHTFEFANNGSGAAPEIDTAQSKFGGASAVFPHNASGFTGSIRSNHADFALGSGDFTVEGFLRKSGAGRWSLLSIGTVNQAGSLWVGGEGFSDSFYVRIGGVTDVISGTLSISTGEFHHFALTRQGTTVRFFVNGVQQGATGTSGASVTGTELQWGNTNGADSYAMNYGSAGHADELRLTKGVARYTANFTPTTEPFPDSANGQTVSIGRAGQNAKLTFSGTAGQNLLLSASNFNALASGVYVRVFNPAGSEFATGTLSSTASMLALPTLSAAGTYTVLMSPNAAATGGFTLQLQQQ